MIRVKDLVSRILLHYGGQGGSSSRSVTKRPDRLGYLFEQIHFAPGLLAFADGATPQSGPRGLWAGRESL